jgi:hypothetical protein
VVLLDPMVLLEGLNIHQQDSIIDVKEEESSNIPNGVITREIERKNAGALDQGLGNADADPNPGHQVRLLGAVGDQGLVPLHVLVRDLPTVVAIGDVVIVPEADRVLPIVVVGEHHVMTIVGPRPAVPRDHDARIVAVAHHKPRGGHARAAEVPIPPAMTLLLRRNQKKKARLNSLSRLLVCLRKSQKT